MKLVQAHAWSQLELGTKWRGRTTAVHDPLTLTKCFWSTQHVLTVLTWEILPNIASLKGTCWYRHQIPGFAIVFPSFSHDFQRPFSQKSPSFLGANLAWGLDIAFTSYQKRAIKTLNLALEELDALWIPVTKSWKLNERMCLRRSGEGWKMYEDVGGRGGWECGNHRV
jgi:hypothetical protein